MVQEPLSIPQPVSYTLPISSPVSPVTSIQATEIYTQLLNKHMASCTTLVNNQEAPADDTVAKPVSTTVPNSQAPVIIKHEVDEAPVPRAFSERERFYAALSKAQPTPLRAMDQSFAVSGASFTVCCNKCNANIPDTHWHCSICQDGDYDLCRECVTVGVHCGVPGHFLIKRNIENGRVISSTTETLPKRTVKIETEKEIPGAFTKEVKEDVAPEMLEMSRTCNSCVNGKLQAKKLFPNKLTPLVYEESNFVTCMVCDDYDLCIPCHVGMKHGHHPNHAFAPVSEEPTLDTMATALCAPGRNMRHFAICDGCDKVWEPFCGHLAVANSLKYIYGVRHKCLNCPDWDYCGTCIKSARHIHPGHRFVPIYEAIASPESYLVVHHGINCDGPLCKAPPNRKWIKGDRYKCAVCHDTDFCANCEALPTNRHNRTHPLIKFRTPVRNVSVTTLGEKENGEPMYTMGDKIPTIPSPAQTSSKSTETIPSAPSANAATQVQTVAEVKPTEPVKEDPEAEKVAPPQLQAHFVRDTVADGTKIPQGCQIQQIWVLRNPGPVAWPAGCSVRFVGGDNSMLNVDENRPSSVNDIGKAIESNIMERAVEVDEEVQFGVMVKAPQRPGKAISYWRLKSADGTPFGHRLWCDIDVVENPAPKGAMSTYIEDLALYQKSLQPKEATPEIEPETKPEIKSEITDEEPKEEEHTSQMIFPKLDKESPVSSLHEEKVEEQHLASTTEMAQLLEDVESLGLDDEESSDDGFLTDEEYEILDADSNDGEAINGKK